MSTETQKKTITANERLQLIGLLALAERHNKAIDDILAAALAITGEDDSLPTGGHTSDAVWSPKERGDADALIARLGLTVEG